MCDSVSKIVCACVPERTFMCPHLWVLLCVHAGLLMWNSMYWTFMCVCVSLWIAVCTCVCMHVYLCVNVHNRLPVCMHVRVCMYECVYIRERRLSIHQAPPSPPPSLLSSFPWRVHGGERDSLLLGRNEAAARPLPLSPPLPSPPARHAPAVIGEERGGGGGGSHREGQWIGKREAGGKRMMKRKV